MNKLLIATPDAADYAQQIERMALPSLEIHQASDVESARRAIVDSDIVLGKPALLADALDAAEKLQWVQSTFAGVDALLAENLRRDYTLTGVKGIFGPLMSEYVIGHILARERDFPRLREQQRRGEWQPFGYQSLQTRTVGIMGLGSIGQHIAATAAHFGMKVLGHKRSPGKVPNVDRVYAGAQLRDFLSQLDYLVITLPHTAETEHLIDASAFDALPSSAVVINVGRGSVVDEPALVDALRDGRIGGAILDVFEEEPLPKDSPLWSLDNVVVTPHVAADSFPEDIVRIFADNYRR
ncbi:MAG: D-2-hydroxyacid dehydrogenase, partial [Ectothiorhodospiraceae bacterium]